MPAEPIRFRFAGRRLTGVLGDTLATALLRNGVRVFDRSIKRRRRRGVSCFEGHCMSCMLEVDGEADILACRTPLVAGMDVRPQLASPSPSFDLRAPAQNLAFRVFGPELYYRLFTRPVWAGHIWMRFLARMAGRGRLATARTARAPLPYEVRRTRLLVVGGGVAGIAAAVAAVERDVQVLLVDRGAAVGGGWQRWAASGSPASGFEPLASPMPSVPPSVEILSETTVMGLYEDRTALAVGARAAYRIHYDAVVIAVGRYPTVLAFPGSDAPLYLPAQGLLRAVVATAWAPRSAVLLDVDGQGSSWAQALQAAGISVQVRRVAGEALQRLAARSGAADSSVRLASGELLQGDVCCWSAGSYARTELVRQAGGQVRYDERARGFVPVLEATGRVCDGVFACGGCAGIVGFDSALRNGERVGAAAADSLVKAGVEHRPAPAAS